MDEMLKRMPEPKKEEGDAGNCVLLLVLSQGGAAAGDQLLSATGHLERR